MKKLFLVGLTVITIALFITSAFAQGGNGNGRGGSKSGSRGTGTCPRLMQNYNGTGFGQSTNQRGQNSVNPSGGIQLRERIMDPTNPNCPYYNY
jgi:hypothetical protein